MKGRCRTIALAFSLIWLLSGILPGADNPCTTRTVLVSVVDEGGNPVRGLTTAHFQAKFRRQRVEIQSAGLKATPPRIVLLLDASSSMTGGQTWDLTQTLAEDLFRLVPEQNSLAMVIFASTVIETAGFEDSHVAKGKMLSGLRDKSEVVPRNLRKTALFDAILNGVAELAPPRPGDAVFAITDAGENRSRSEPSQVEEVLVKAGVRFFAIVLVPPGLPRPIEEHTGSMRLAGIAKSTGGNMLVLVPRGMSGFEKHWHNTGELEALRSAARRMYEEMRSRYALEIMLPMTVDKPRGWKVWVVDDRGRPRRDVAVHYPRKLLTCESDLAAK